MKDENNCSGNVDERLTLRIACNTNPEYSEDGALSPLCTGCIEQIKEAQKKYVLITECLRCKSKLDMPDKWGVCLMCKNDEIKSEQRYFQNYLEPNFCQCRYLSYADWAICNCGSLSYFGAIRGISRC